MRNRFRTTSSASGLGRQLMCVTPERIGFVGRMGDVAERSMGALTIYLALDAPFQFRKEGHDWQQVWSAVAPPFVRHGFISNEQRMAALMIEPELIAWTTLVMRGDNSFDELRAHFLQAYEAFLVDSDQEAAAQRLDLAQCQRLALGHDRMQRRVDPRIARVIDDVRARPQGRNRALQCANGAHLSFSRFLHLFRAETGLSFRSFAAWKRARFILETLTQATPLTDIALDVGYRDSSYFSNSVRGAYGLTPREMFARCAQATVRLEARC